ncbi:class I SAM-dependent methyltransferase [Microbispora sp. CA-135349]|uniref:class I SAM-dependent methyltransferase n=1 Tax=Microbispora sp. CA-135349 TaxID=3239953 RepID=UPI003D936996
MRHPLVTETYVKPVEDFYLRRDPAGGTVFDVWERGEAVGDSITPSTYDNGYRAWMGFLLHSQLGRPGEHTLISVGCGNAMIESELVRRGHGVTAVDVLPQAVSLAQAKGVPAVCADVMTWTPSAPGPLIVYADGLLGHLYSTENHSLPILDVIHRWLAERPGSALIISNDESHDELPVEPARGVPGFHWFSAGYLQEQCGRAGFTDVDHIRYTYQRPLSGPRHRVVLMARG